MIQKQLKIKSHNSIPDFKLAQDRRKTEISRSVRRIGEDCLHQSY